MTTTRRRCDHGDVGDVGDVFGCSRVGVVFLEFLCFQKKRLTCRSVAAASDLGVSIGYDGNKNEQSREFLVSYTCNLDTPAGEK